MTKCPKCYREIPDEIHFCPYCMGKFTGKEVKASKKKKTKQTLTIIGSCIMTAVICFVIFLFMGNNDKKQIQKMV